VTLALASAVLHGAACVLCLMYAFAKRRSEDRQAAYVLAIVWCGWFGVALLCDVTAAALPPPSPEPLSGLKNRALLAVDSALHLAWPMGILAWVRWSFRGSRPWPVVLAWLVSWGLPTAVYPAIRGASWFWYAGAIHVAALVGEIAAISSWVRRREHPRPWHVAGFVAAAASAFPVIPFFVSSEARAGYLIWVLRGLVVSHLALIAVVGGELWSQRSRGSSRP
jgi:hypothetical protein